MDKKYPSKMIRQLNIYYHITTTYYHGPNELMKRFHISLRMLQRDLMDLRDCGVLNVKYQKSGNNYILSDKNAVFDETAKGRHRQHLIRLHRLVILIDNLPRTYMEDLRNYESAYDEYTFYRDELMVEDPETYPPEELGDPPVLPEFPDIKAAYYSLFPDSNERTRQRDFKELNNAGFCIYYSRKYKTFIFEC